MEPVKDVGAVVLAAGQSVRMGQPKMLLEWGKTTVVGKVVQSLLDSGISQIVVVTGGVRAGVEQALAEKKVECVYNPQYANGEMLNSLRVGVRALPDTCQAFLLVLGDQPQMETRVVKQVIEDYQANQNALIVPSYQMRRGHPWLVDRELWPALLDMPSDATMRDFIQIHSSEIHYIEVDSPSVLKDVDTVEDYLRDRPVD